MHDSIGTKLGPHLRAKWPVIEARGLRASGLATLILAAAFVVTGLDPRYELTLRNALVASGAALALAGVLIVTRVREDLVLSILGGLTTAVFAVVLATLQGSNSPAWSNLDPPMLLGGCLLGVLAFRGAFRGASK